MSFCITEKDIVSANPNHNYQEDKEVSDILKAIDEITTEFSINLRLNKQGTQKSCCIGACYLFAKALKKRLTDYKILSEVKVIMRKPDSLGPSHPRHCVVQVNNILYDVRGRYGLPSQDMLLSLSDSIQCFIAPDDNGEYYSMTYKYSPTDSIEKYVKAEFHLTCEKMLWLRNTFTSENVLA